jgi:hypothetical protein
MVEYWEENAEEKDQEDKSDQEEGESEPCELWVEVIWCWKEP